MQLTPFRVALSTIVVFTVTAAMFAQWNGLIPDFPARFASAFIAPEQPAAALETQALDPAIGGPSVSDVTSTNTDRVHSPGESITIDVIFNAPVTVGSGTPTLALNNGQTATYTSGSGTDTLSFDYTIQVGDMSVADLDYASTAALSADISTPNSSTTLPSPGSAGSLGFNKNIGVNAGLPGACDAFGNLELNADTGTSTGSYATLKAAFDAINLGTHTGVITIDVCGNTTEAAIVGAASVVLNASGTGSSSYSTIGISPAGGARRTISGAATAGFPLIDFPGPDGVTINGLNTGGNALTISNSSTAATAGTSTIRYINDAVSNTIQNTTINGAATGASTGNIIFSTTTGTTGNDNNTVTACNIGPVGATSPANGILSSGTTTSQATRNSGIQITNNNIFDFFTNTAVIANGVLASGGTTDATITGNSFYQTATRTMTVAASGFIGISISDTSSINNTVSNNFIGGRRGFGRRHGVDANRRRYTYIYRHTYVTRNVSRIEFAKQYDPEPQHKHLVNFDYQRRYFSRNRRDEYWYNNWQYNWRCHRYRKYYVNWHRNSLHASQRFWQAPAHPVASRSPTIP